MSVSIDQLVEFCQMDLSMSGLFPKILPDTEIKRLIKENALDWFYKNYQFSVIKHYYYLNHACLLEDNTYTKEKYIIMPDEIENITRIYFVSDPSLFRIGVQSPNLSLGFGVTNSPYLTSFVENVGSLAVYRQILSAFSDELNKMAKNFVKYKYNNIDHRLHILSTLDTSCVLETYIRIEQDELFDNYLFKEYVFALATQRMGQALSRFNMNLPGNFQYNANDIVTQGTERLNAVKEKITKETQSGWFIMSK